MYPWKFSFLAHNTPYIWQAVQDTNVLSHIIWQGEKFYYTELSLKVQTDAAYIQIIYII